MWCYGQILSKLSEWVVQSGHLLPFYHNSAGNVKRQCPLKLVQILAYSILVFVFFLSYTFILKLSYQHFNDISSKN